MKYEIRELSLGECLDQGIAVIRDNFGLLLGILACLWIPFQLLAGFAPLMVSSVPPPTPDSTPAEQLEYLTSTMPVLLGFALFGGYVILPITNAAVTYAVAERYLGKQVTVGASLRKGFSKFLPLLGTTILYSLAVFGGTLLCIIPGIIFAVLFGLYQYVVVIEDKSGSDALSRSKLLMKPYWGQFLVLGILIAVISGMIQGGAGLIPQIHAQIVVQALLQSVVTLISTAVFVVFYFSCRSGVENFDLELLAQAVGESAPPHDEPVFFDDVEGE